MAQFPPEQIKGFYGSSVSKYASSAGRRERVYFAPFPLLWAFSLASRSVVQPQYSVPSPQRSK